MVYRARLAESYAAAALCVHLVGLVKKNKLVSCTNPCELIVEKSIQKSLKAMHLTQYYINCKICTKEDVYISDITSIAEHIKDKLKQPAITLWTADRELTRYIPFVCKYLLKLHKYNITIQDYITMSHMHTMRVRAHTNILCTFNLSLNIL